MNKLNKALVLVLLLALVIAAFGVFSSFAAESEADGPTVYYDMSGGIGTTDKKTAFVETKKTSDNGVPYRTYTFKTSTAVGGTYDTQVFPQFQPTTHCIADGGDRKDNIDYLVIDLDIGTDTNAFEKIRIQTLFYQRTAEGGRGSSKQNDHILVNGDAGSDIFFNTSNSSKAYYVDTETEWQHITLIYNTTTNLAGKGYLYVNGEFVFAFNGYKAGANHLESIRILPGLGTADMVNESMSLANFTVKAFPKGYTGELAQDFANIGNKEYSLSDFSDLAYAMENLPENKVAEIIREGEDPIKVTSFAQIDGALLKHGDTVQLYRDITRAISVPENVTFITTAGNVTYSMVDAVVDPSLGHTPGEAADCYNDQVCTECGAVVVEKLGHVYDEEITLVPTCQAEGIKTLTCSLCGYEYTEVMPVHTGLGENNHNWSTSNLNKHEKRWCLDCGIEEFSTSLDYLIGKRTDYLDDDYLVFDGNGISVKVEKGTGTFNDTQNTDGIYRAYYGNVITISSTVKGMLLTEVYFGLTKGESGLTLKGYEYYVTDGNYSEIVTTPSASVSLIDLPDGATSGTYYFVLTLDEPCESISFVVLNDYTYLNSVRATGVRNPHECSGDVVVENTVDPTCDKDGSYDNVVYCNFCGEEVSRETIISNEAIGHDWTDATCETPKTCNTCGATEGTAHIWVADTNADDDVLESCSLCGYVKKTSTVTLTPYYDTENPPDNVQFTNDGVTVEIDRNGGSAFTATNGIFRGKNKNIITVTAEGKISKIVWIMPGYIGGPNTSSTCNRATQVERDFLEGKLLGGYDIASYSFETIYKGRTPDSTAFTIEFAVPVDTLTWKASNEYFMTSLQVYYVTEPHVHEYEADVTAPDCVNGGYTTYTCACGDTYKANETAALGHTAGAAADCENDQTCTVCGEVLATKLGHTAGAEATCVSDQTCTVCGEVLATKLGHTPGAAADCENDQVCTVCGEVLATKLGHDWVDATYDAPKTCTVCGATEGEALKGPSGKVSYRAYITDSASREAIQIDLENVYATESFVIKLYDAEGNLLTTTSLRAGKVDAANFTCNIVLWGSASGSWNTTIHTALTIDNVPARAEVIADGVVVDSYQHTCGNILHDKLDAYKALDCVAKAAKIGNAYYATLADAIAAAEAGDTVTLLADINATEIILIDKAITLDGNGKTINSTAARAINVEVNGDVTIKNVTINAAERAINIINKPANVTVENVIATANNNAIMLATSAAGANLTVNASTLTGLAVVNVASAGSEVVINNTAIINVDASESENYGAITVWTSAAGANVTVNGGSITVADDSKAAYVFPGDASVTLDSDAEIGYIVATVGDAGFETLAGAIAYAQAGQTVKLVRNLTLDATLNVAKNVTIDLAGKTISGTCNASQSSLVFINNGAKLTVKDSVGAGKMTFAQGASNVGWTVDVKGEFVLESGIIELTGTWGIGYAVDVRPNSWGTEYTMPTVFTMNGGSIVSSDGGVRVASSSASAHKKVSATFVMNGGLIDADWDGVFIQQSDAVYDDLSFVMNGGTIESDLNPVRVYGPAPTGYVNDSSCMNITLAGGTMTYTGTETYVWVIEGILRVGGGSSVETILANGDLAVSSAIAESVTAPEGYEWVTTADGSYTLAERTYVAEVNGTQYESLQAAIDAAKAGDTVVLLEDLVIESALADAAKGIFNIAADDEIVIDLNGKTIKVTDNSNGNFILFYNYGKLTIKNGTVEITSTINRGWNAQSTAILNRGGILVIESGSYIHNGGTDMAITVDNSANSFGDAYLYVNGGIISSTYTGIRMRMADPTLNGNPGNGLAYLEMTAGTVYGASRGIWAHITNASTLDLGALAITGGTVEGGNQAINIGTDSAANIDVQISGSALIKGVVKGEALDFAITGGKFTTDVSALLASGYILDAEGNVIKYVAVIVPDEIVDEAPEEVKEIVTEVVQDVTENKAVNDFVVETPAEVETFEIELSEVVADVETSVATKITFVVAPKNAAGDKVSAPSAAITFRLPIPANWDCTKVIVTHNGEFFGSYTVYTEGDAKYIEVTSDAFSEFAVEPAKYVAEVNGNKYDSLAEAFAAAKDGATVTLLADIELSESINIPEGAVITLDLAGYTIAGIDTTTKSFGLINNRGTLTVKDSIGGGKITLVATNDNGWSRYSSVISNNPGGKLIVESGIIEHLGGTSMSYAIDNLTNGKGTYAEVVINGGTINSAYIAIRQFLNGVEATNKLTINGGIVNGANSSIYFQDPSANANSGSLTIEAGAIINKRIYLGITAGSTEWPVEISVAAEALAEGVEIVNNGIPAGYEFVLVDGVYVANKKERVEIEYTNVTLTSDFMMSFAFAADSVSDWTGYYVVITKTSAHDGSLETIVIPTSQWYSVEIGNKNYIAVNFAGVAAKELADTLTIVVYNADGEAISDEKVDSIKGYCMRTLADSTTDKKLATLVVDILNYGAEAQIFFNYATDKLANADLTDEQKALASSAREYSADDYSKVYADGYSFQAGHTLTLEYNIQLKAGMDLRYTDLSDDAKIVISYVNYDGKTITKTVNLKDTDYKTNILYVSCDTLTARDAAAQVKFELIDGDAVIYTFTNSVESFTARSSASDSDLALCEALMKYCDSASAYFTK